MDFFFYGRCRYRSALADDRYRLTIFGADFVSHDLHHNNDTTMMTNVTSLNLKMENLLNCLSVNQAGGGKIYIYIGRPIYWWITTLSKE
jgi:hypothetical protein